MTTPRETHAPSNALESGKRRIGRLKYTCGATDCRKHACFGYRRQDVQLYCRAHCAEGMVNVVSHRCIHEGCQRQPSFAFPGNVPFYCKRHRVEGTHSIRRKCDAPGCDRIPSFAPPNEIRACFCARHRPPEFHDVVHRRCSIPECNRLAHFSFGSGQLRRCEDHREIGMVASNRRYTKQPRSTPDLIPVPVLDPFRISSCVDTTPFFHNLSQPNALTVCDSYDIIDLLFL